MKVLSVVCDTPGWTYISEIFHEMLPASTREAIRHPEWAAEKTKAALEPILLERFSHLDFDFCFCFRCLDRDSGWVSKARLYKNDDSHSWYTLSLIHISNVPTSGSFWATGTPSPRKSSGRRWPQGCSGPVRSIITLPLMWGRA